MNNPTENIGVSVKAAHCEKHGAYESRTLGNASGFFKDWWTRCPSCEEERRVEEESRKAEKQREEMRERWGRKLGFACIPERFQDRRLDNFDAETEGQKKALQEAKAFADDFERVSYQTGRSMVFIGTPGTGKTHLAIGIALQLMESGYSALFITVMRAIRRVKDTWGKGGESESEAISTIVAPDLLILDEVGIQFGSETEKLILFDILNERYEKRKPCILLSNFTIPEVKAFLGERIFDRLREDGGQVVTFDWESHRGRA